MADQCIVCLENLDVEFTDAPQEPLAPNGSLGALSAVAPEIELVDAARSQPDRNAENHVARIHECGHMLHDVCLRAWSEQANSCPICRQIFHLVHVHDKVGAGVLSSYKVQDKKQEAEFDPQAWLYENPDEEEEAPCPVCDSADDDHVLLLCDGCDTPYHTYCVGLTSVPSGDWFCIECAQPRRVTVSEPVEPTRSRNSRGRPRTRATRRQARHSARSDEWQGAWGQISGRIWDALSIDLDYHDDDDHVAWQGYRRSQQQRERERDRDRHERERWQQRLQIASRLGARDVFANNISNVLGSRSGPASSPPTRESRDEQQAWNALERAREVEDDGRKRKSPEPDEPREAEPSRQLKRPRLRLGSHTGESSSSGTPATTSPGTGLNRSSIGRLTRPPRPARPSFLSSLLEEVETSSPSDQDQLRNTYGPIPGINDATSPATSSPTSGPSSPRASSLTPPPVRSGSVRTGSPPLSLSSRIEPIYPRANYSPARSPSSELIHELQSSPEKSDSERQGNRSSDDDLRQPRPRRSQPVRPARSADTSSARSRLPLGTKQNISAIVRGALKPHWRSQRLTSRQYEVINREVSRKIYEMVTDPAIVGEDARQKWEKMATRQVSEAVAALKGCT